MRNIPIKAKKHRRKKCLLFLDPCTNSFILETNTKLLERKVYRPLVKEIHLVGSGHISGRQVVAGATSPGTEKEAQAITGT